MSKQIKSNKTKTNKERKVKFFTGERKERPKSAPIDIGPPTKVISTYDDDCVMIDVPDIGDYFSIEKQSANAELVDVQTIKESIETKSTTTFHDEAVGQSAAAPCIEDHGHLGDNTPSIPLGKFLERPILIKELSWDDTRTAGPAPTSFSFNPWAEYLNNTVIKRKVDNYAFIRGNLHVKAIINASPFYYGRAQLAYQPLVNFRTDRLPENIASLMPYSQRLSIWINPSDSEGGEVDLPFFYHKNWLDLTSLTDVENMGIFDFVVYTALDSANGVSSVTLPIQIFAWMSEVEVMGPTDEIALQSSKSQTTKLKKKAKVNIGKAPTNTNGFKNTTVSETASAIAVGSAEAAGVLTACGLPELAPFALGVAEAAAGVSALAGLLGFTNTPLLEPTRTFKNQPLSQLASPEISGPLERLCIDPQNGITIDNKTVGLSNDDNMMIKSIACKDSYLTSFALTDLDTSGQTKFVVRVTPALWNGFTSTFTGYNLMPMYYIGKMFNYWRGDITFTFNIICTKYHKGRIRISYEPNGSAGASGNNNTYATNFTRLIDIGLDDTVSITVPYMQATPWLRLPKGESTYLDGTLPYAITPGDIVKDALANGILTVKVVNTLSAPVSGASIKVHVWAKGGDNIEFACPRDPPRGTSLMVPQSGAPEDIEEHDYEILGGKSNPGHPKRYLINHGEAILSFRQLLRRTCLYRLTQFPVVDSLNDYVRVNYNSPTYPMHYGYDPNGVDAARTVGDLGDAPFNYCINTPFHYLTACYVGMRGSMNKRVNIIAPTTLNVNHFAAVRLTDTVSTPLVSATGSTTVNSSDMARQLLRGDDTSFAAGATLTNFRIMPTLEYNVPMYNQYKFISTDPYTKVTGASYDGSDRTHTQIQLVFNATASNNANIDTSYFEEYFCIGPDFSVVYFLNIPPLWRVTNPGVALP